MPKINVLKPFQPSPTETALSEVRQCEAELADSRAAVEAIPKHLATGTTHPSNGR